MTGRAEKRRLRAFERDRERLARNDGRSGIFCPTQKRTFASKAEARRWMRRKTRGGADVDLKTIYRCRRCGWWHTSSMLPLRDVES